MKHYLINYFKFIIKTPKIYVEIELTFKSSFVFVKIRENKIVKIAD